MEIRANAPNACSAEKKKASSAHSTRTLGRAASRRLTFIFMHLCRRGTMTGADPRHPSRELASASVFVFGIAHQRRWDCGLRCEYVPALAIGDRSPRREAANRYDSPYQHRLHPSRRISHSRQTMPVLCSMAQECEKSIGKKRQREYRLESLLLTGERARINDDQIHVIKSRVLNGERASSELLAETRGASSR